MPFINSCLLQKVPPIRGKVIKDKLPKDVVKQDKSERIKSFDYNAWSKFDVVSVNEFIFTIYFLIKKSSGIASILLRLLPTNFF